jgi:hypothetical protein
VKNLHGFASNFIAARGSGMKQGLGPRQFVAAAASAGGDDDDAPLTASEIAALEKEAAKLEKDEKAAAEEYNSLKMGLLAELKSKKKAAKAALSRVALHAEYGSSAQTSSWSFNADPRRLHLAIPASFECLSAIVTGSSAAS